MNAMQGAADTLNGTKNAAGNHMKRAFAKVRHPMRSKVSSFVGDKSIDGSIDSPDEAHVTTGEYATSAGHAIIREIAQYLQGDQGEDALRKIFACQAGVIYDMILETLLSKELQVTSRMIGREIVFGSSEGLQKTFSEQWEKLPRVITVSILPVAVIFVTLFMLGLLLALWRFALFGLHH